MILPYTVRLLCICFATFFLVHAALSLVVWACSSAAIRFGEALRPRLAARILLFLRLSPFVLAIFVVTALCIPSYLWLEPDATFEQVGILCVLAAILGMAIWIASIVRVARAWSLSLRYRRQWECESNQTRIAGHDSAVFVTPGGAPLVALAGIVRPRIIVSQRVLGALRPEELDAALRHERAHDISHDNLKRLLVLLAPGVLPFVRGFASLDRAWARFTEWAADDHATAGESHRSLSLAAALVHIAQMGAAPGFSPLASSLFTSGTDLRERVDRLLGVERTIPVTPRRTRIFFIGSVLVAAIFLAVALSRPETFYFVHGLLEQLIH